MPRLKLLGAFSVCLAASAFAQEAPPSPAATLQQQTPVPAPPITLTPRSHEDRENRYRMEHRIVLNVLVSDSSGNPVAGLKQEDFTLLDNGQARTVASFRAVKGSEGIAPLRVILFLDAANNSPRGIANDLKGVEQFLKQTQVPLKYKTSIGILSDSGATVGPPSQSRDALIEELRTLTKDVHPFECTDQGGGSQQVFTTINLGIGTAVLDGSDQKSGCLNQRFKRSVSALKKLAMEQEDVPGRVILIWIGPGWPLLLNPEFRVDSKSLRQNLFDNLAQLSNALREAQVTLDAAFSPDLSRRVELRSDHDKAFFNGVPTEDQVTASSLGLQVLAHQSGGQIQMESKDLASEIAKCVDDAESYYVLSFDSPSATTTGEFHSLRVNLDKPELKVRTNTAYYAEP
jgi:VWFA-related protein